MKHVALVTVGVLCVVVMCGCGGGGSGIEPTGDVGTLSGTLVGASNPQDYQIIVDGQPLDVAPAPDGTFRVPNLPAGKHSVAFVGGGGMMGAYVDATVVADSTTSVGNVTPGLGGQIVGLVMQRDADGNLSPLEGVEVLADSDEPIYVIQSDDGTVEEPPVKDGDALQFKAITDANGSYVIPAVPEGSYVVTVNVPGLTQGVQWVWVSPGTTSAADFQLEAAIDAGVGTIAGTVVGADSSGGTAPLEGAMVSVYTEDRWQPPIIGRPIPLPVSATSKLMSTLQAATGFIAPSYWFQDFSTLTDASGNYSLNVPSGYVNISVWAEGYDGAYERFALQPRTTATRNYTLNVYVEPEPEPEPVE
jgi:hypothetical protein